MPLSPPSLGAQGVLPSPARAGKIRQEGSVLHFCCTSQTPPAEICHSNPVWTPLAPASSPARCLAVTPAGAALSQPICYSHSYSCRVPGLPVPREAGKQSQLCLGDAALGKERHRGIGGSGAPTVSPSPGQGDAQQNGCKPLSCPGLCPGAVTHGDTVALPSWRSSPRSHLLPGWISEQGPFITHYSSTYLGLLLKCCF